MDMHMPLYPTQNMTTTVSYQPGVFAYDSIPVNPFSMQQSFPTSYTLNVSQAGSYSEVSAMQSQPPLCEPRNGFIMERTPSIKTETLSPIRPVQVYNNASYNGEIKFERLETGQSNSGVTFNTDVDTLMKAIQAKQRPDTPVQHVEPRKVGDLDECIIKG
jgi:hypothetical protein